MGGCEGHKATEEVEKENKQRQTLFENTITKPNTLFGCFIFKLYFYLCVCILVCVCINVRMQVPVEARRWCWMAWSWSYRHL